MEAKRRGRRGQEKQRVEEEQKRFFNEGKNSYAQTQIDECRAMKKSFPFQ
jgi:hypothetical protein